MCVCVYKIWEPLPSIPMFSVYMELVPQNSSKISIQGWVVAQQYKTMLWEADTWKGSTFMPGDLPDYTRNAHTHDPGLAEAREDSSMETVLGVLPLSPSCAHGVQK